MTDPIADMLVRIKNAQSAKKESAAVPYSKIKMEIAKILVEKGFAKEVNRRGKKMRKSIEIILKYDQDGEPAIKSARRVSKFSKRVYLPYKMIRPVRQGFGIRIFSTPNGLLAGDDARKLKVGGEALCDIW